MSKIFVMNEIKLGADPELFVLDPNDKFVPSLDLVGGSKWNPRSTSKEGFYIQEDNVLVEYNIPPSMTRDEFANNILTGIKLFEEYLPKGHKAFIATSHKFLPEQLLDPRAIEFGCEPDRNAWLKGKYNEKPPVPEDGLRTAGGHIHIGYKFNDKVIEDMDEVDRSVVNRQLVKWMDLFLGVPSMLLDTDSERRRLYGKAGAYRDKEYGVEYRTLSSFWLGSRKKIEWAFDQTMRAVEKVSEMKFLEDSMYKTISASINEGDSGATQELIKEYSLELA